MISYLFLLSISPRSVHHSAKTNWLMSTNYQIVLNIHFAFFSLFKTKPHLRSITRTYFRIHCDRIEREEAKATPSWISIASKTNATKSTIIINYIVFLFALFLSLVRAFSHNSNESFEWWESDKWLIVCYYLFTRFNGLECCFIPVEIRLQFN